MSIDSAPATNSKAIIHGDALPSLLAALFELGYQVVGPRHKDAAIIYDYLEPGDTLPSGWQDHQEGGKYHLTRADRPAYFDYVVGPHAWKRFLFPPRQRLWRAERRGPGFHVQEAREPAPRFAFVGVRSCDLHAIETQDRVFLNQAFSDSSYQERRNPVLIVAVNCARPAATCFCDSMGSGPRATGAFDLALTELLEPDRHAFVVEVGSPRGAELLARLPHESASPEDLEASQEISEQARGALQRSMVSDVKDLLQRNLEHPRWEQVASRCLSCGNCTMVCPTCFCSSVEDVNDLDGTASERWRRWDSCFGVEFSYVHGGSVRREVSSRYRQWMTHKLSTWWEQFGSSGCVGCGRCITWCPVGIDITEEARAIHDSEGEHNHG